MDPKKPDDAYKPNPNKVYKPKPTVSNSEQPQSQTGSSDQQPPNYQETVTGTYQGADFVYTHTEYTPMPGAPDLNSIQNAAAPRSESDGTNLFSTITDTLRNFGTAAASRLPWPSGSSAADQIRWAVLISAAGVDRTGAAIKDTQKMEFSSLENAQKYAQTVNAPRLRNNEELYHVEIVGPYNKASPEQTGSSQTSNDPSGSSLPEFKPRRTPENDGLD